MLMNVIVSSNHVYGLFIFLIGMHHHLRLFPAHFPNVWWDTCHISSWSQNLKMITFLLFWIICIPWLPMRVSNHIEQVHGVGVAMSLRGGSLSWLLADTACFLRMLLALHREFSLCDDLRISILVGALFILACFILLISLSLRIIHDKILSITL